MNNHASTSAHLPIAFSFCWTDDRLELLIDHYYAYLVGNDRLEYCLTKLKQALNKKSIELDNNCHEIEVDDDGISSKLTELTEIVKSKSEGVGKMKYGELKEILGKDKCNKLKNMVRHTKFKFYSPPTYVEESVLHIKKRFYWTDSRLRLLVTSYHSYLEKIYKVTRKGGCRKDCLTFIKRSFGNVSFDELTRKFNEIFQHQNSGMNNHASTSAHLPIAFSFCWTDDRLELLIDHYYAYLVGNVRLEYCLTKLKQALNKKSIELDNNCHEIEVDDDGISSKLTELTEIVKSKSEGVGKMKYGELKEILGKDKCNKLKNMVTSYHSNLEKIYKVTRKGGWRKDCLTFIKRSFGNVSFDELTRKLNEIFQKQNSGGYYSYVEEYPGKVALSTLAKAVRNGVIIDIALQGIVSDELTKINDDLLWEYDGLRSQPECEDILLEMQNIFYQDIDLHQTTQQTSWEDDEDDYLARLVYQHMQLNDGTVEKTVWCPICKQGELQENHFLFIALLVNLDYSEGKRYMAAYGSYVVLMSYGTYGFADYGTYVRCFPGFLTLFGSP
ncbi:hypothetical protein ACET3Z_018075 [Daucus carota]